MYTIESFFWLLFWIAVHWNGLGQEPSVSKYDSWNSKNTEELAEIKKGKVDEEDKFNEELEKNVVAYYRPLIPCIQELRKVVFPEGRRRTSEDPTLFSQMKAVLGNVRRKLSSID